MPAKNRKIPFIIVLVLLTLGLTATADTRQKEAAQSKTARALTGVQVTQKGRSVVLIADSARRINLSRLSRFPSQDGPGARSLCFRFTPGPGRGIRRLCLGGPDRPLNGAGLTVANAAGRALTTKAIAARIKRPSPTRLVITTTPQDLGLTPRSYDWQLIGSFEGAVCPPPRRKRGCSTVLPATNRWTKLEIKRLIPVGCTTGAAGVVTRGLSPRGQRLVALTFDDGPSSYTDGFLRVLKEKKVRGTFFVLGQLTAAYPDLARRIVNEGHEIANHSWKHDLYPSASDLKQTSSTIRSVTGFKPCSFRPPGGARNSSVVAGAGRAGMKTVIWDVDPFDWRLPGTDSIRRDVLANTRPGSIVLSHDGGGPRSQTLAALPGIIDTLRARGYTFTTVTEILGGQIRNRLR